MPRTRSLAWAELKVGVLTIVAVVIAAVTVFMLTGSRGFFWQRYNLKTRFENVAGLKSGSPVRVAGVEVGTVTSVDDFVGEQIDVSFEVNKSMRPRITTGSTAYLGSVSLLGESAVDITPSTKGTPIPDWGYVPPGRAKGQIADVAEQAQQSVAEITKLVTDIRLGKGTVGKLMTDEQLYTDLQAFAASAGDPPISCVFLLFSGAYRATMRCLGAAASDAATRISFFFAAMMPLSVAYRSWLIPLWMVNAAGSGMATHWNQPPSSSRFTRSLPPSAATSMMIVACGHPSREARMTPVCAWP